MNVLPKPTSRSNIRARPYPATRSAGPKVPQAVLEGRKLAQKLVANARALKVWLLGEKPTFARACQEVSATHLEADATSQEVDVTGQEVDVTRHEVDAARQDVDTNYDATLQEVSTNEVDATCHAVNTNHDVAFQEVSATHGATFEEVDATHGVAPREVGVTYQEAGVAQKVNTTDPAYQESGAALDVTLQEVSTTDPAFPKLGVAHDVTLQVNIAPQKVDRTLGEVKITRQKPVVNKTYQKAKVHPKPASRKYKERDICISLATPKPASSARKCRDIFVPPITTLAKPKRKHSVSVDQEEPPHKRQRSAQALLASPPPPPPSPAAGRKRPITSVIDDDDDNSDKENIDPILRQKRQRISRTLLMPMGTLTEAIWYPDSSDFPDLIDFTEITDPNAQA
ncbi:hypothetical protein BC937DRAFT_93890 [Endogone sp. FLAS-F59071]|nr:hypothetical protein BC937DRAFT_93890 [Endogone sp. FLAS-F59071]|eukprot:RUS14395.1 hypothetical protein BC937DRAFT_93890 [Endogone sp. FLAS-F59071]